MKTVFARALVTLAILALPVSAFASTKTTHSHSVAKKEPKKKGGGKHHGHKTASSKTTAPTAAASKAP